MSEIVDCIAWIVRKTFWSLGVLLKFLGLRLLDLLGLVFNLLACCTIIRLPFMIAQFGSMDSFWSWRLVGIVQLLIFISDLPIMILGLFILITMWRVYPCYTELKENWEGWKGGSSDIYYTGWKLRATIITQFFKSCIDIFCVPTSIILLLSWRSVIFVRKMKKAESDSDRRKCCFIQFFQLLLDIPLLLLTVPPIISWRLPFLIRKIRKHINEKEDWDDIRLDGPTQFLYLFLDIPCILMFLITLVTWRCPILIWQLSKPEYPIYKKRQQWTIRKIVTLQFLYLFLDIPCIICTSVIAVTLWRLPTFVKRCRKKLDRHRAKSAFYKKEMKLRQVCVYEFCMIFVDLICCLLFLVVFCTLWRAYPLVKAIKGYLKRYGKDSTVKIPNESENRLFSVEENKDATTSKTEVAVVEKAIDSLDETKDTSADRTDHIESNPQEIQGVDLEVPDAAATITEPDVNEDSEKKSPLTWSKCMWKIRKTICFQFAMLLLDLPAIPLCVLLLITGLRTTRLFSDLLGGEFYMLFAVSVYYHTLHFFIDCFFILMFLILVILRPVQIWINLLEDEEHKKHRELIDIMKWMPDISKDRHKVYTRMDDILSMSFKSGSDEYHCVNKLTNEMDDFIERINDIIEKLEKHEIEDEFVYLVKTVRFLEKHRPGKMIRLFNTELHYLRRPNTDIRERNLTRLQREKLEYQRKLNGFYEKLSNYKPAKIPLYENKSGLSLRTRDETKKVLIQTLPRGGLPVLFGVLVCCLPLYRAPRMLYRLVKRWYSRFDILKSTLYEYALDFVTIIRIMFVTICLYRAPFMFADIMDCVIEKRSWTAVRKVVKRYPGFIFEDIYHLLWNLLSWKTPRFIFTALLFGFFMPADLFLTVSKSCSNNKCIGYLITIVLYVIFMGFPFVYSLYGANELMKYGLSWTNVVFICVFIVLLLLVLLLMVVTLIRDEKKSFLLKMPDADYVRYNWYNMHVILFEILEFLQSLALIFKLTAIPMYGGHTLSEASKILLFSFLPFEPIFWITVAVFIIWFFTCGAPIIFENILETFPVGTCGKRPSWRLAISLLANTLFLFFVENFISFSACKYEKCPSEYTLGQIPTNATCLRSTFVEDNSLQCWMEPHRDYAAFGLIGLVWYTTTALIFDTTYGDPDTPEQDIGFSPIYNTVINILKAAMVVCATIITSTPYATLTCLLVLNLFSILFTFGFKLIFKYYPCNVPSILVWRLCTFVSTSIVVIAALIAYSLDDESSKVPLLVMAVGIFVTFIICFVIAVKLRRISKTEKDRENFRREIQRLEERVQNNKWFLKGWEKKRGVWFRLVKSVRSAQKQDKKLTPQQDAPVPATSNYQTFEVPPPIFPPPTDPELGAPFYVDQPPPSSEIVEYAAAIVESVQLTAIKLTQEQTEKSNIADDDKAVNEETTINDNLKSESESDEKISPEIPGDFVKENEYAESRMEEELAIKDPDDLPKGSSYSVELENTDKSTKRDSYVSSISSSPSGTQTPPPSPPPPPLQQPPPLQSPSSQDIGLPPPPSYEAVHSNQDYYSLNDVQNNRDEILRFEKNGRNLLMILEKYIDYKAYKYSFFLQRELWLNSVWNANWSSLLQCLRVLSKNISGDFNRPSALDLSLAAPALESDILQDDDQDLKDPPPPFVKETREMKEANSKECRERALRDIANYAYYGHEWKQLFERLLPTIAVIKSWEYSETGPTARFTLKCRRAVTGKIIAVDESDGGNKLAKGATLGIGKTLSGSFSSGYLQFPLNEGIVGKKGPVSMTVSSVSFIEKKKKLYISVSGKKAPLAMALASSKEISWE